ncbi:unnamed protein product [Rhizoctonia solani]|uniref:F-box-like domain protein n=1 Tax=Rhizoctonia solani TaxID=456999 RepID=A0A8H3GE85_9AGAM|nr:unnamed protein product [Rhizoctonia solani]
MIEELVTASTQLQGALDRYLAACSTIQKSCIAGIWARGLSSELASRVVQELELLATYESALRHANSVMRYARNVPPFAPINALPREVMSRIFSLAAGEDCALYQVQPTGCKMRSKHADLLTHVCSHWRQIALGSRTLWSHIDIHSYGSFNTQLISRADVYASRAGDTPLVLHVHLENTAKQPSLDNATFKLIASIAPRTRALILKSETYYRSFLDLMLETALNHCTPGILTQLSVRSCSTVDYPSDQFLLAKLNTGYENHVSTNDQNLLEGPPRQRFDNVMLHLTNLHMGTLFIPWSSRAYHNLTELCVTRGSGDLGRESGKILESDLVVILRSSPFLRRLELDLVVLEGLSTTTPVEPIALNYIEILKVAEQAPGSNSFSLRESELGPLLRWIAPGSKSLQFSITCFPRVIWTIEAPLFKGHLVKQFFSRSNVTTITAKWLNADHQVADLWNAAPTVQTLILEEFERRSLLGSRDMHVSESGPCLDTLYLLKTDVASLNNVIRILKPRRIFLWDCYESFLVPSGPSESVSQISQNSIIPPDVAFMLPHIPAIEFLDHDPRDQIAHQWDFE